MSITNWIAGVDIFKRTKTSEKSEWATGFFVGRPFKLTYSEAKILVADAWKEKAKGIPQGSFLLAYYDVDPPRAGRHDADPEQLLEAILLRVVEPTELPTDADVISSMVEYYKENIRTGSTAASALDEFTHYEFSFSGLRCSVLGCFYKEGNRIRFGADLENFYSAHNYSVIKPSAEVLRFVVNYRESGFPGGEGEDRIGRVRYSSSQRFPSTEEGVPVFVKATDFAGRRTGLFGMTRTGKSNTIKQIIRATEKMSARAPNILAASRESEAELLDPFAPNKAPKYPIGQIIFDINGEYANPNLQDDGTAIADLYRDRTILYSVYDKRNDDDDGKGPKVKVLKVNFYNEVEAGFELIKEFPAIRDDDRRFIANFRSVLLEKPKDDADWSAKTRYERQLAVYYCILFRAGFEPPPNHKTVTFKANQKIRDAVGMGDPEGGFSLAHATEWWTELWKIYKQNNQFKKEASKPRKGRRKEDADEARDPQDADDESRPEDDDPDQKEWVDDDLRALLVMLTRCSRSGGGVDCNGYLTLREITRQHTSREQVAFEDDILSALREGKIVIVDLSLGDESLQRMFSGRISQRIFRDSMRRFTKAEPNNFIQFYFEEAHNLFPKKDDKDLSQVYVRIAKEGAKLNLGLVFATQELSSISGSILKNTQNWFVSHLNNEEEIRELRKYYDFSDFSEGLVRFSQDTDKGFARMKSYSNAFVVPIQVDRFKPGEK